VLPTNTAYGSAHTIGSTVGTTTGSTVGSIRDCLRPPPTGPDPAPHQLRRLPSRGVKQLTRPFLARPIPHRRNKQRQLVDRIVHQTGKAEVCRPARKLQLPKHFLCPLTQAPASGSPAPSAFWAFTPDEDGKDDGLVRRPLSGATMTPQLSPGASATAMRRKRQPQTPESPALTGEALLPPMHCCACTITEKDDSRA
jgi:hypothetical protein